MGGHLATRIGVRAGSKLTLGAIPVIGAAVGATTNGLMMDSLCNAAEKYSIGNVALPHHSKLRLKARETEPNGVGDSPRVCDLLCMINPVHASTLKEHDDNDDFQGTAGRAAERS